MLKTNAGGSIFFVHLLPLHALGEGSQYPLFDFLPLEHRQPDGCNFLSPRR